MCDERTFTDSVAVITRSRLVERIEALLPAATGRATGGAPREMTVSALLVGLLVLARLERPLILRDVTRFYERGPKRRLAKVGLARVPSERMVSRLFQLLDEHVNPSRHHPSNALLFEPAYWQVVLEAETGEELGEFIEPAVDDEEAHAAFWAPLAERIHAILEAKADLLDELTFLGLQATHPRGVHSGSYALDHTKVISWAKQRTTVNAKRRPPAARTDPDAGWRDEGENDAFFGYTLTAITRAPEAPAPGEAAEDVPLLIEHLGLRAAHTNRVVAGVQTLESMTARHGLLDEGKRAPRPRRDLLADREYSVVIWWQERSREMGFEPVFALSKFQQGLTETLPSGILVIDGQPYSPGTPEHLHHLHVPSPFASIEEHAVYAEAIAERETYRIRQHGRRDLLSPWKLACPASSVVRQVRCMNKPASLLLGAHKPSIGSALPVIGMSPLPSICAKSTVSLPWEALPYSQRHTPGSAAWRASYFRRNNVESSFGNVKNCAVQDISRGHQRVVGRSKTQVLVLFTAMAANLRLRTLHAARVKAARSGEERPAPVPRIPRPRTRRRIEYIERALAGRIRAEWEAEDAAAAAAAAATAAAGESDPPPEPPAA